MKKNFVRLPLEVEGLDVRREIVIAEPVAEEDCYRVRSIPAFVYGLAAGDVVRIIDRGAGRFKVLSRGGGVTIRVFVTGSLERNDVRALIDAVERSGGQHEIGRNDAEDGGASLLLISLNVSIGFAKIESLLGVVEGPDVQWEYGNVYDASGAPMNWWAH